MGGVVLTVERSWARNLADRHGVSADPVDDRARREPVITIAGARRRVDDTGVRAGAGTAAAHESTALDNAAAHDSAATTPHNTTAAARDRAADRAADDTTDHVVGRRGVRSRAGSAG
jgi:hypothetical protein